MANISIVEEVISGEPTVAYRREYDSTLISQSSDVLWGRPTFAGTRVPVDALFDYLEDGESIDTFADHFGIEKDVVRRFLNELQETLFR
ncbi:MAG: DUF433 domain-containing protein [Blastocatellia bacterium]|nr:DUF433 domain-containing protein [Blastocatellia bacterium]